MKLPNKIINILNLLYSGGYEAYVIGGAVRDELMGRTPKDYDIVTSASPEEVMNIFPRSEKVGNCFPVVLVGDIEVATYRIDVGEGAEITQSLEEDVIRRDFTINTIASNGNHFLDHVGGLKDIENRILRFVGDPITRIKQDPLRMLRGIRFAAQYNLEIETETFFAIQECKELFKEIPGERISQEIIKIFKTNHAYKFLEILDQMELLQYVFPNLMRIKGIDGGDYHRETVLNHCFYAVKALDETKNWKLKLAALYHDIGKYKPEINEKGFNVFKDHCRHGSDFIRQDLGDYLKFPTNVVTYVRLMSEYHMDCIDSKRTIKRLYTKLLEHNILLKDFLYLRYADKKGNLKSHTDFKETREKYKECLEILNEKQPFSVRDLEIDGHDVMQELGIQPGRKIGEILNKLFELVQDEIITNERDVLLIHLIHV